MAAVIDSIAAHWYLVDDPRLSGPAGEAIEQARGERQAFVSVASIFQDWHYHVLDGDLPPEELAEILLTLADERFGWVIQSINVPISLAGLDIGGAIRDPADRMIMATAIALDLPLVTNDGKITRSRLVEVVW